MIDVKQYGGESVWYDKGFIVPVEMLYLLL